MPNCIKFAYKLPEKVTIKIPHKTAYKYSLIKVETCLVRTLPPGLFDGNIPIYQTNLSRDTMFTE